MKILEAMFVQEFCQRTNTKVLATKKTIGGQPLWIIVPDGQSEVKSAQIYGTEHDIVCTFSHSGRRVQATFDLSLNLKQHNIGVWETEQEEDRKAFEQKMLSFYASEKDWSSDDSEDEE